jgi:protein SCO1/2
VLALPVAAAIPIGASAHEATAAPAPRPPQITGHFTLATMDGRSVTDESYRGKWLVIYFGYTFCPDACPTTLSNIGSALDGLGPLADHVQPLFVTVDPTRDTVNVVTEYLKAFDPRIVGLRGTPEQTEAAAKQYHVYYRARSLGGGQYAVDHSSFIYVIDPTGQFAKLLTADLPGHQLADGLRALVK